MTLLRHPLHSVMYCCALKSLTTERSAIAEGLLQGVLKKSDSCNPFPREHY